MDDEEVPKPTPEASFPRNLEALSLEALRAYIGELEAEIDRVRQDISAKERLHVQAENVFRS
ncbi:MAG: DUF1192 domain-containing protein [Alphaproteobacteria bacterium]|jgi:uncharacterized small protein (DUF1192 family)|nr:DUF1192 domain-containing protein [Alphaproteobacteria bacterium]MDP6516518.1 DUF1192 domain-containing protein [Alphaproteobacteria bacterium]|tara:strand:- start:186 stop:371 length:186 start_codon:yes stop_codon:yes gene_type:complete